MGMFKTAILLEIGATFPCIWISSYTIVGNHHSVSCLMLIIHRHNVQIGMPCLHLNPRQVIN